MPRPNEPEKKVPEGSPESLPSIRPPDSLQEKLESQVGELLPPGSRGEIIRRITTVVQSELFQGPIAHPKHLREYEAILPGAADRIIGMAEAQQQHQIGMERLVVDKEYGDRRWGMVLGAGIFVVLIVCAFVSAYNKDDIAAGLFLTATVIGGVGLFVNGRKNGDKG